jgi:RNA polymerase sigma factor (sigma-70 family)
MSTDRELLAHYAETGSETAFAELVRMRVGFVYGTALLRVGGDTHLAHDVTQQVFIALAREASRLKRHPVLTGWLHTTTRNISAALVRTERRRRTRENEASTMQEIYSETEPTPDWQKLRGHLGQALDALREKDRDALLLRFFEGCSFADVGNRLQLSENAARMRVERALEKMQALLSRHGITSTATAIGAALATPAAQALPAGFAATISSAALAGAGVATVIPGIVFMSITKLQFGIAVALIAAGAGGFLAQRHANGKLQARLNDLHDQTEEVVQLRRENSRLKTSLAQLNHAPPASAPAIARGASTSDAANVKSPSLREANPLAPGLTPIGSLDHSGRTTPRAAFSTQLWAAAEGDVDLEQSAIALTPEGRAKLAALLATLPPASRSNYATPEKLMASVLAGSPHPVGGMQVLGETARTPDDVILDTEWQHADDSIVHHSKVELQHDGSGWRMVVPMVLVDRAVAYMSRNYAAGAGPTQANK